MEKPNRADRRKNKFGGGRATEHGGWPTHQPNPVFGEGTADADPTGAESPAVASRGDAKAGAKRAKAAPEPEQDAEPRA